MEVTFFLAGERDLERLARVDPDRDWWEFQRGERAWVLQAYLRLARAGWPVRLAGTPPAAGVVVFHAKHERELCAAGRALGDAVLVGVRADNREPLAADFEIVQNGRFADGRRRFALPHWPQPGLLPRDPTRGSRLERAGYKGFDANLHPALRAPAWRDFLAARGIEWVVDSVEFAGAATDALPLDWPDYRTLDLVVAVRPPDRALWRSKPASKLFNAWLAGVPALLGPEVAYRELRRSPLDYLEVASRAEAEAAVERLLAEPARYAAMVENGRARAAEFTAGAILPRWAELLFGTIPALAAGRRGRRLPLPMRRAARRLGRAATLRPAR
ncbi:MAG TPA: glycosyltransferase [Thermoanaerobaculia bacterium]